MNLLQALLSGRLKIAPVPRVRKRKPERKAPKLWRWESHRCVAHTKSEARAHFKRLLKLPTAGRLPAGANVALLSK